MLKETMAESGSHPSSFIRVCCKCAHCDGWTKVTKVGEDQAVTVASDWLRRISWHVTRDSDMVSWHSGGRRVTAKISTVLWKSWGGKNCWDYYSSRVPTMHCTWFSICSIYNIHKFTVLFLHMHQRLIALKQIHDRMEGIHRLKALPETATL